MDECDTLSTLLEPQSRCGGKPLKFQVVCPQNGTAAQRRVKNMRQVLAHGRICSQKHGASIRPWMNMNIWSGWVFVHGRTLSQKHGQVFVHGVNKHPPNNGRVIIRTSIIRCQKHESSRYWGCMIRTAVVGNISILNKSKSALLHIKDIPGMPMETQSFHRVKRLNSIPRIPAIIIQVRSSVGGWDWTALKIMQSFGKSRDRIDGFDGQSFNLAWELEIGWFNLSISNFWIPPN